MYGLTPAWLAARHGRFVGPLPHRSPPPASGSRQRFRFSDSVHDRLGWAIAPVRYTAAQQGTEPAPHGSDGASNFGVQACWLTGMTFTAVNKCWGWIVESERRAGGPTARLMARLRPPGVTDRRIEAPGSGALKCGMQNPFDRTDCNNIPQRFNYQLSLAFVKREEMR
jgi:hypothetical protein